MITIIFVYIFFCLFPIFLFLLFILILIELNFNLFHFFLFIQLFHSILFYFCFCFVLFFQLPNYLICLNRFSLLAHLVFYVTFVSNFQLLLVVYNTVKPVLSGHPRGML